MVVIDATRINKIIFKGEPLNGYLQYFLKLKRFETLNLLIGEFKGDTAIVNKVIPLEDYYEQTRFSGSTGALFADEVNLQNYPSVAKRYLEDYQKQKIVGLLHNHWHDDALKTLKNGLHRECVPSDTDITANIWEEIGNIAFSKLARVIVGTCGKDYQKKTNTRQIHVFAYRLEDKFKKDGVLSMKAVGLKKFEQDLVAEILKNPKIYWKMIKKIEVEPRDKEIGGKKLPELIIAENWGGPKRRRNPNPQYIVT